jgi:uncharacterized protein YodC (DUF2158 family)
MTCPKCGSEATEYLGQPLRNDAMQFYLCYNCNTIFRIQYGKIKEIEFIETFEIGDIVYLKSGGPAMTVKTLCGPTPETYPIVGCVWFDGGTLHQELLNPGSLVKKEPASNRALKIDPTILQKKAGEMF